MKDIRKIKLPDVRPLSQRLTKRINPGQLPDAKEQLLFSAELEPCPPKCSVYKYTDPESDIEPDYVKQMRIRERAYKNIPK